MESPVTPGLTCDGGSPLKMRKSSTSECDENDINDIHDIDIGIAAQKNEEAEGQGPSASISRKLSSLHVHCGLPSIAASNGSKVEGVWKGRFFVTRCDDVIVS